jgi:RecJ-like exonuclease
MTSVKPPEPSKESEKPPMASPEKIVEVKKVPIVCDVCKDTGAVAAEKTVNTATGEETVTKWANCTNCYLDKDEAGEYVRKLGVKPDPEALNKALADKKKILDARAEEERIKAHRVA